MSVDAEAKLPEVSETDKPGELGGPNRREVIVGGTAVGTLAGAGIAVPVYAQATVPFGGGVAIWTSVNGVERSLALDPRSSLLDVLREQLELTGAKKGCDHGQCGACTVHIDGRRIASCLTMAVQADGREVTTIEGLSPADAGLHPMQQAFIDNDALQCGYCTPGQIMAAVACVAEGHATNAAQIREYMSGNLCRCGAYVGIVAAIEAAALKMQRS